MKHARWLRCIGVLLVLSMLPRDAIASEPSSIAWHKEWPRFAAWEGFLTFTATYVGFVFEHKQDDPSELNSHVEVPLLDPGARFLFRGRSKNLQDAAGHYSDMGFRLMVFFNYADALASAAVIHRNVDTAWQMALIDLEALTLAGLTQVTASRLVARPRPYVEDCGGNHGSLTRPCNSPDDYTSFFSGHAMGAFTGAGLVCVHHQHLPLYGGGPVEAWACTWALGVATATSVLRLISDDHYASDVLFGAGVGWFYGYVMPKLVHYRSGKPNFGSALPLRALPSLAPVQQGAVLSLSGIF